MRPIQIRRVSTLGKALKQREILTEHAGGPIPATTWAVIEANSGIIAACLPLLRQPFVNIFGRFAPTTRRTADSNGGYVQNYGHGSNFRLDNSHRSFRPAGHTVEIGQQSRASGESEEHIVGKDIYVLRDVSVTSTVGTDAKRMGVGYCEVYD